MFAQTSQRGPFCVNNRVPGPLYLPELANLYLEGFVHLSPGPESSSVSDHLMSFFYSRLPLPVLSVSPPGRQDGTFLSGRKDAFCAISRVSVNGPKLFP